MAISKNLRSASCPVAIAAAIASIVALPARRAEAATVFGERGTLAVSVEEVTGYHYRSLKYWNENDRTVELKRSNLSLAFASGGVRLGIHYFIIPNLSLGGTFGFESVSASDTYQDDPGTWTRDLPSEYHLILAPRVGYALMFIPEVGFWFRGGIGYEQFQQRPNDNGETFARDSFGMLSADVLFVWCPLPHFGVLVGPTVERSFLGHHSLHDPDPNASWSNDARFWRVGLGAGVMAYF